MSEVVRAAEASPGWYVTRAGRAVRVVSRARVSGRWPPGRPEAVPYRSYGDPSARDVLDRVDVCGWLPADYALTPAPEPPRLHARMAVLRTRLHANLSMQPAPPRSGGGRGKGAPPAPGRTSPAVLTVPTGEARRLRRDPRLPPPGSSLVRTYRDVRYVCEVTERGFVVGGQRFGSLSAAARSITGSEVNGFAFFRLVRE